MDQNESLRLGRIVKALFEEMGRLGKKPMHDGSPVYYKEEFNKPVSKQVEIKAEEGDESMQMELFLN